MNYRLLPLLLLGVGCAAEANPNTPLDSGLGNGSGSGDASASNGADSGPVTPQDGGSTGGGSTGGSSDGDASDTCASDTFVAELKPSALMFQIDTSRSMNCPITDRNCLSEDPTSTPGDSRWDVFREKLQGALDELPNPLATGLMHYPNPDTGCAPTTPLVAIGALGTTRSMINAKLAALQPDYITPTRDAVRAALAQLRTRSEAGRYLLLATDGAASVCLGCNASCANSGKVPQSDNDGLVADVKEALETDDIRTFVIGVPGSQTYQMVLSQLAEAGGTARANCTHAGPSFCHYDLTDATVDFGVLLAQALAEISGNVLSCEFPVPTTTAFDPGKVNVSLTDGNNRIDLKRDAMRADGWDYVDDGKTIRLFGGACDRAKQLTDGKVDIIYGCPTIVVL